MVHSNGTADTNQTLQALVSGQDTSDVPFCPQKWQKTHTRIANAKRSRFSRFCQFSVWIIVLAMYLPLGKRPTKASVHITKTLKTERAHFLMRVVLFLFPLRL
jgi:hypothetical protein